MKDIEQGTVEAIAELAQKAMTPTISKREDGTPFALFNDGSVIELGAITPSRKKAVVKVADLESLVTYAGLHRGEGSLGSVGWGSGGLVVVVVLDHHAKEGAGWCEHSVRAEISASPAWAAWLANDRKELRQAQFAEWLEDRLGEVRQPAAAELFEVVKSLEASAGATFKGTVRLQNGDRAFSYAHTTEAKAGQSGELVIPSWIGLELPLLRATPPQAVGARFKYRLTPDGLMLRYEIERRSELEIGLVEAAADLLRSKLPGLPVLLV